VNHPSSSQLEVLAQLRRGPRQARQVAQALGVNTSAARRHLETLVEAGWVGSFSAIEGRGRPKKLFDLTAAGRELFPREYALLLQQVLAKVEARDGRGGIEAVIESIARDFASKVQGETAPARFRSLVALYNSLGFEASGEKAPGGLVIVQRNCVFMRAARADPGLFCKCLDEGIVRSALPGATVELVGSQALGAAACRHRVSF
jgi:predicted ArsR family transcriptional regulator